MHRNETSKRKTNQSNRLDNVTDNVTAMLLQNLDENVIVDLQSTVNDSQNTWTKNLRD